METEAAQEAAAQQAQLEEEAAAKEGEKAAAKKAKKQRQKAKKQQEQQQQQQQRRGDACAQQHVQPSAVDEAQANGGVLQQLPLPQQQALIDPHSRKQKIRKLKQQLQQPQVEVQIAGTEHQAGSAADAQQSNNLHLPQLPWDEHQKPRPQQQQQSAEARLAGKGDQAGSVAEVQQDDDLEEMQLEVNEQHGHQQPGPQHVSGRQQQKPETQQDQKQLQKPGSKQDWHEQQQQQQQRKLGQPQQQQQQQAPRPQQLLQNGEEQQQLVSGHVGQQRQDRNRQLDSTTGPCKQHHQERVPGQALLAALGCSSASQSCAPAEGPLAQAKSPHRGGLGRQAIPYLLCCPLTKVTSMLAPVSLPGHNTGNGILDVL